MIGVSRMSTQEVKGLALKPRTSLSDSTVIWQGVWPANRPRIILDSDWVEKATLTLGLEMRAEVGPTDTGPWTLWASATTAANRPAGTDQPWINAPAPAAGTHVRFVATPTGTVTTGGVIRASSSMKRSG